MKVNIDQLLQKPKIKEILDLFKSNNIKIRFVGGCVRDLLSARLIKDIDFAIDVKPELIMQILEKAGFKVIPTGIKHGTVSVVVNHQIYEITTLRKDIETFGRHAVVEYTDDFELDAKRRDFTINAMSIDSEGILYDYFSGLDDLKSGNLRFVGNAEERIQEDYLRILRYFRFAADFQKGPLDQKTVDICAKYKFGQSGHVISAERIRNEMVRLLATKRAPEIIDIIVRNNIDSIFGVKFDYDKNSFIKLRQLEEIINTGQDVIRNLAVVIGFNINVASHVISYWKLSNKEKYYLIKLCDQDNNVSSEKIIIRKLGKELFIDKVLISKIRGSISDGVFKSLYEFANTYEIPQFPLTGDDLIKAGFEAGKGLGELLNKLEEFWEENDYKLAKEDLIKLAKK